MAFIEKSNAIRPSSTFRGGRLAYLGAIGGAIFIGLSPILVRWSELGPIATGFYRVSFAIPFFALLLLWDEKKENRVNQKGSAFRQLLIKTRQDHLALMLIGFIFGLNQIFWHLSLQYTYVANATLLANMSALFVIPLGWLFFGRRVKLLFIVYALCSFSGVALLLSVSMADFSLLQGDLMAIGAAVCYAFYQLAIGSIRRRYSVAEQMLWTAVWSSIFLLPCVWLFDEQLLITSFYAFIVLFCLSFFCHFIGQGAISFALGYVSPNLVSLTLLIQPVTAAILGWIVFSEMLGGLQLAGMLIILLFIYLARRTSS